MIIKRLFIVIFIAGLFLVSIVGLAAAQDTKGTSLGTDFTYQGNLKNNNVPYTGLCDLQFGLYDALTTGTQLGNVSLTNVPVTDGYFTVVLDYGQGIFKGEGRWLEISVRCPSGVDTFTLLTPRQSLSAAPYALSLPGLWTIPNSESTNIIGGFSGNFITPGVVGSTISGGGKSGSTNRVFDSYNTIGGGYMNIAGDESESTNDALSVTIGGGVGNVVSNHQSTIGGGSFNYITGEKSFIGGGGGNQTSGNSTAIAGGQSNIANSNYSFIGGGEFNDTLGLANTISGGYNNSTNGDYSTISGGYANSSTGFKSTVGGGSNNISNSDNSTVSGGYSNTASGIGSTIPGGINNDAAGHLSFAAGNRAKANSQGCFVWGDSSDADITCSNINRWIARAVGGVYFYTGISSGSFLATNGSAWNAVSARDLKENFTPIDTNLLLENIAKYPITSWNYKAQDASIRHIGLMADEFNALLDGLGGEGMDHINSLDADGVALAAIQGLYDQNQELIQQTEDQANKIDDLETRIEQLEKMGISNHSLQSSMGIPFPWLILLAVLVFGGNLLKNQFPGWRQ